MRIPNYRDQIKIVFFDIDETLLVKDEDYIPATVVPAIRKLKENGIVPAIATGRTLSNFPPKIKGLIEQTDMNLFVTMNGQYVSYQNEPIGKHPLHQINQPSIYASVPIVILYLKQKSKSSLIFVINIRLFMRKCHRQIRQFQR